MHPKRRPSKPLKRSVERRAELRTIVIFCEGKNSEPDYIRGIKRIPEIAQSSAVNLEIDPEQGVPLTLVRRAGQRLEDPEVDECWCLFDVEWPKNHPNLRQAIELAKSSGVELAISNPCFELWLLLHFKDSTAFLSTADAERASKKCDGRPGKSINSEDYVNFRRDACRRAIVLDKRHAENGTLFPKDNPSSGVYRLIQSLDSTVRLV